METSIVNITIIMATILFIIGLILLYFSIVYMRKDYSNKGYPKSLIDFFDLVSVIFLIIAIIMIFSSIATAILGFYQSKEESLINAFNDFDKTHYELIEVQKNSNEYFIDNGNLKPGGLLGILLDPMMSDEIKKYEVKIINDNDQKEIVDIISINTDIIENNSVEPNIKINNDGSYDMTVPIK